MDDSLYSDFGNISGRTLFRLASKELPKFSTPVPVFQLKKKPSRRGRRATRLSSPSLDENITPQTLIRNFCKEQIARNSPPFVPKEDEIFRIQRGRNRSRRSSRALPELEETSVEENETTEDRSLLPDITDISAIESGPKKRKLQLGRLNPPLTFRKLQKTHSPANAEHLACSSSLQGSSRTTSVRRKQNASPMTSDSLSSDFECPSDINLNTKVVKGSPVPVKQKPFSEKEIPHLLFDSEASSTIPSGKLNLQRRSRAPLFPNRKSNDLSVSLPLLSERVSVSASSEKNSLNNIHQSTARPSRQSDKNISSNSSQFQEPDGAAFAEVRPQTSNIRMASKSGGFHEPSDADVESSNEEEEASIHTQDTSVADDINQLTESCERNPSAVKSMSRISQSEYFERGLTSRSLPHSTPQVSQHSPLEGLEEQISADQNIGCDVAAQSIKKPKTSERTSLAHKSMSRVSESEHREDGLTSRSLNRSKQVSLHAPISDSDEEASNDPNIGCSVSVQSVKKPKTSERTSLARKSMSRVSESEHLEDGLTSRTLNREDGLTSRSLNRSKQVSFHVPLSGSDEEASNDPNIALSIATPSVQKSTARKSTSFRQQKSVSQVSVSDRSQKKSVASPSGDVSNQENADVIPHDFEDSVHAVQQKHKISLQKSHHAFRRAGYSTEEIELSQSMSPVKIPSKLSETISLTQNKSALQRISSQNSTRVPSASPQDNEGIDFDCVSHVTKHVTRGTIDRDEEKSVSKRRSQKDKTPQTAISHLPKTVSRTSVSQQDDNKSPSYFINQPNISMHGTPQVFEDATYQAPRQTRIPDKNTTRGSRKSGHLTKASESEPSTSLALSIRPSDTGSVKKKMHSTAIQDSNETVSAIQNVSVAISPIRKKLLSGKYVMLSSDDDKNEMEHSAGNSDECDESADDMHAKEFPLLSDVQDHEQEHMSEEELGAPSASHIQKKHRVKKSRAPRISALDTKHFVEQFAGMKLSRGALNTILESTDIFWENTFEALQAYSKHANRQTIDVEDVELLLYRQRLVHDRRSINALIAEYMPMELRRKLIPMAVPKCSLP